MCAEFPFSSERKRMSVICQLEAVATGESSLTAIDPAIAGFVESEQYLMFTKGSPELTLERCTKIHLGNHSVPINDEHRSQILVANDQLAGKGLRVLGFAYKPLTEVPPDGSHDTSEVDLVWLGLVGMLDAPRPEVRAAVARMSSRGNSSSDDYWRPSINCPSDRY